MRYSSIEIFSFKNLIKKVRLVIKVKLKYTLCLYFYSNEHWLELQHHLNEIYKCAILLFGTGTLHWVSSFYHLYITLFISLSICCQIFARFSPDINNFTIHILKFFQLQLDMTPFSVTLPFVFCWQICAKTSR